jgi:[ribosomal protein S5]-alanine N-acetyltransferase
MELTTERLWLRPFQEEDWEAVHEYAADPEVSRHQPWGPNTEEATRQFLELSIREHGQRELIVYHFALILRESGQLIGGCTLRVTNPRLGEAMIGYTLHRHFWNQGYTTETARALLELGFQTLQLHRITSWCTPENVGSWRVMEKIGMRREGREREAVFFKSEWRDWLRYAILDHEWHESVSAE